MTRTLSGIKPWTSRTQASTLPQAIEAANLLFRLFDLRHCIVFGKKSRLNCNKDLIHVCFLWRLLFCYHFEEQFGNAMIKSKVYLTDQIWLVNLFLVFVLFLCLAATPSTLIMDMVPQQPMMTMVRRFICILSELCFVLYFVQFTISENFVQLTISVNVMIYFWIKIYIKNKDILLSVKTSCQATILGISIVTCISVWR